MAAPGASVPEEPPPEYPQFMRNRSVPADIVLPHIVVRDIRAAIEWLAAAFGFQEHYRYGDPPAGAQLHLGEAYIMLCETRKGRATPAEMGACTQMLTVFV